jgi:hypothetical protein
MKKLNLLLVFILIAVITSAKDKKAEEKVTDKLFSQIMIPELTRENQKNIYVVEVEVIKRECLYRPNKFGMHTTFGVKDIGGEEGTFADCFVSKKNDKEKIRYTLKVGDKIRLTGKVYMANYMMMLKAPTFEIFKIEKM